MNADQRSALIAKIRALPAQVAAFVAGLSPEALGAHPIPGEWSIAQNVHHLFDSHANAYVRCKLIMTEDRPTLKPYDQDAWAALSDASQADVGDSLLLLRGLHARWAAFFEGLREADWSRAGIHPELPGEDYTLARILAGYAAHGEAHLDQMERTRRRL